MTPAEHLAASKEALKQKAFDDGLRHVNAIFAGAPEISEGQKVREEIEAAKEAARREADEASQAAQLAEERRQTAVRDLQDHLTNLGYDLTVAQSDKHDEIIVTSKDFGDADHRVRFLAFLRRETSQSTEACLAGFQTVRLRTPGSLFDGLFGFSQTYSLECFTSR